jgi:hypothetical protein
MTPLSESDVVDAVVAIIKGAQVPVLGSDPPATEGLKAKVFNRWVTHQQPGQVMSIMKSSTDGGRINGWEVTVSAWNDSEVKFKSGANQTPPRGFTPGFDDAVGSESAPAQYKRRVEGNLKIWQVYQFDFGNDNDNSERRCRHERGAVIRAILEAPRLGLTWFDFRHEGLKFPSIVLLPGSDTSLHFALGNLPFSFSYVVQAAN